MTALSDTYNAYINLKNYLNKLNQNLDTHEKEELSDKICVAICELETVCAYIPVEDKNDKQIKFTLLKNNLLAHTEDCESVFHPDNLTDREREALMMAEQLEAAM